MRYTHASTLDIETDLKSLLNKNYQIRDCTDVDEGIVRKEKHFIKGLVLYGKTGRGKTHTLYAIKNFLKDSRIRVYSWQEVLFETKNNFNTSDSSNILKEVKYSDFIFIDDIGVEKDSDWSQEMLYMIINYAYIHEKPVFLSTNLNLVEFGERYGDRIMARLEEMAEFYELKGADRRIKNG